VLKVDEDLLLEVQVEDLYLVLLLEQDTLDQRLVVVLLDDVRKVWIFSPVLYHWIYTRIRCIFIIIGIEFRVVIGIFFGERWVFLDHTEVDLDTDILQRSVVGGVFEKLKEFLEPGVFQYNQKLTVAIESLFQSDWVFNHNKWHDIAVLFQLETYDVLDY